MNTEFQDQLTRSILLLTPGMLLLAVLGVLGLLMMLERLGLLGAREASPQVASAPAESGAAPTDKPAAAEPPPH